MSQKQICHNQYSIKPQAQTAGCRAGVYSPYGQVRALGLALLAGLLILCTAFAFSQNAAAKYASYVINAETGEVLHAINENTRNYPASLTKIMTLYMLFEAMEKGRYSLNSKLKVSKRAAGMPPSKLGLKVGETITVENAILALTTKSANDVAVVVAEALADAEWKFARDMTAKARELGMSRTSFRNASGLPNRGQLSTARDMAILGIRIREDFPDYYSFFSRRSFQFKGKKYKNHNNLLADYKGSDGIKTGYIRASGFNLVASVKRDGSHLIGVVLGGKTAKRRDAHMKKLLTTSFAMLGRRDRGTQFASIARLAPLRPDEGSRDELTQLVEALSDDDTTNGEDFSDSVDLALAGHHPASPEQPIGGRLASLVGQGDTNNRAISLKNGTNWVVQVGAFRYKRQAEGASADAFAILKRDLDADQDPQLYVKKGKSRYYRAWLIGFSKPSAYEACGKLKRRGVDCFVVETKG